MATKGSTSTSTSDPEKTRIVGLTALADRVEALAAQITGGAGKSGGGADVSRESSGGGSVDEQVRRAVEAARQEDAARSAEEKRQQAIDERIKGLEERTEKRPTERSRLSRWMWGDE